MADDMNKEENEQNQENQRVYSRWQARQKINKLNQFHLSKDEKYLIRANDSELRDLVIKELTKNIEEIGKKIDLINKSKKEKNDDDKALDKKKKKNLITKIQKLKKCLKDEGGINARIKLLKQKARKLRSTKKKIEENLGNLKNSFKRCLNCKKRGHLVEDCPFKQNNPDENNDNNNDVICYNCGSYEHTLYKCDKPIDYNNLPYALCFRCNKRGHISANCPDNENGIYVHGGACFVCGAKDHLAKNCPEKQAKEEAYKMQKPKKNEKKEKKNKKKNIEEEKEINEKNEDMNDNEEKEKDEEESDKE